MRHHWVCNVCEAENHEEDGECQFCECGGAECKRDNCSGSECGQLQPIDWAADHAKDRV